MFLNRFSPRFLPPPWTLVPFEGYAFHFYIGTDRQFSVFLFDLGVFSHIDRLAIDIPLSKVALSGIAWTTP